MWCKTDFEVKMLETPQVRSTFRSCDVEKVHAVVARRTFPSQNVQNTPTSEHFWKLRCGKSARRCGAKHISKGCRFLFDLFFFFLFFFVVFSLGHFFLLFAAFWSKTLYFAEFGT